MIHFGLSYKKYHRSIIKRSFVVIIYAIKKLWCKGTNKRESYNGINAEPLTNLIEVS